MAAHSVGTDQTTLEKSRVFVLDTNVLIHDPTSLFRFEEHDVCLPVTVIEEIDNNKKGQSEVARNSRQVARWLNKIISGPRTESGIRGVVAYPLSPVDKKAKGKLLIQTEKVELSNMPQDFDPKKADNHILQTALYFKNIGGTAEVVLVTKDIMMAVKAKLYGITTQDYENDKVLDDSDSLPTGIRKLPKNFWDKLGEIKAVHTPEGDVYTIETQFLPKALKNAHVNEFAYWEDERNPFLARVIGHDEAGVILRVVQKYDSEKNSVFGVKARNHEQSFALGLLRDPEIDFVTMLGQAGTGKTLLAVAAGLEQVMESKLYSEIVFTRATVPLDKDIGFLPGTEEEKMNPWMGALDDNLEVLLENMEDSGPEKGNLRGKSEARKQLDRYIKVKSLNFMRGRTFLNKWLIIDEAQNLTPKQMKALITRAGPGTKVVCLGNLDQIDTPYLTEGSSGLTYAVERFRSGDSDLPFGWAHSGHIILPHPVRSRLASQAIKVLK
ncbi:MAG: PhoH family protein [bacterium]|nr:PhoH family protein [bacterium]